MVSVLHVTSFAKNSWQTRNRRVMPGRPMSPGFPSSLAGPAGSRGFSSEIRFLLENPLATVWEHHQLPSSLWKGGVCCPDEAATSPSNPDCVDCVVLPRLSRLLDRWMHLELSAMCHCSLHPPVLGPPKSCMIHDARLCGVLAGSPYRGHHLTAPTVNWLGTPNLQSRYRGHVAKHEAYCNWVPLGKMLSRPGAAPAAGWLPPPQSCASHGNR